VLTISRPKTLVLGPVPEQIVSSKFDWNRDRSLILIFPSDEEEYITVTPRTRDDLTTENKGRIHYLQYKDQCKPASYFFTNTTGNLVTCEFFNSKWYKLHHWVEGYRTSKDLKLTIKELKINDLAQQDTSLQGMPPTEVEDLLKAPEPEKRSMDSPINNAMSLLSIGEELEEHIASTMVAMTQIVPPFAGHFAPTRPGGPSGPGGPGGPAGPGGPGGGGHHPATQNIIVPLNGMWGTPPSIFDSNKKGYLPWKMELRLYQLANQNHPIMTNAAEKMLCTMGFIWGPNVAACVEDELQSLEQRMVQWGDEDPWTWELFEQGMDRAFKDVNTKDQAITELMNLQMTGDQLNVYNTTFNQLLQKCGWNCDEQGTMQLYHRGLIVSLLRRMLDQDSHPGTLDGWQDLAIKYQGKWLEAQHELAQRDSKDTSKQKAYLLQLLNRKQNHGHICPEDRMDVDVTGTSDDKKERRVCYYCKLPGHIWKDCWKRMADKAKGRKPQTQVHQAKVVDEEKEDILATMRKNVKAMKESKRRDFLGVLIDKHF
jgi:hypothetical protein